MASAYTPPTPRPHPPHRGGSAEEDQCGILCSVSALICDIYTELHFRILGWSWRPASNVNTVILFILLHPVVHLHRVPGRSPHPYLMLYYAVYKKNMLFKRSGKFRQFKSEGNREALTFVCASRLVN